MAAVVPVSRASIENELAKPWSAPRAAELVGLFDADEAHYRYARQTTIIAAALYMSLALAEPFIMKNTLGVSIACRLVLSPAVLAWLLWFFRNRPPLHVVHRSMGLTVALAAAVWSYIMLTGTYDGPNYYFFAGFLFFLTSNIFMRLKFREAVLSSGLVALIMAADSVLLPQISVPMLVVNFIMLFFTVVLTLYANWSLDQKSYTLFLHQLLGALDQQELAKRNLELQALSSTDALTGIGNRRAAEAALDELWHNERHGKQPFALAIIDVDFFKLFNDHYGHVAGDGCLRMVAEAAQAAAERLDARVFRLGGEEFIMVLTCDDAGTAIDAAGAVLHAVRQRNISHLSRTDALRHVSISIGVAFSGDVAADGLSDFLEAADLALYKAKSAGRNQVVAFSPKLLGTFLSEIPTEAGAATPRERPRDAAYGT